MKKSMTKRAICLAALCCLFFACEGAQAPLRAPGGYADAGTDTGADADADADTDTDADTGADTADNLDTDSSGTVILDCSKCPKTGDTLEAMLCAADLCDPRVLISQTYLSPTKAVTKGTFAAVNWFGSESNDLAPLLNGSYALMATGPAKGKAHSMDMGGIIEGAVDPFSKAKDLFNQPIRAHDVMEWQLKLKVPKGAHGIRVHYVFFSEEYDDYIGKEFNDKFYIFMEAASTNGGKRTVINFTKCRNPSNYSDFLCSGTTPGCDAGEKYCYIAINTALSECCWFGGCKNGKATTDISGTGFSCAQGYFTDGDSHGSSTGWLKTEWPVEPGEEINLIFHIHDTQDHAFDSEVIIDKIQFVGVADPGTGPV